MADSRSHRKRDAPDVSEQDRRKRSRGHDARELPHHARQLRKHDLESRRALFALYLDVQKQLDIDQLDETELKGRWKSFLGKWNRAELSEGYYDPATRAKAESAYAGEPQQQSHAQSPLRRRGTREHESSDDDYGPPAPRGQYSSATAARTDDLTHRDELLRDSRHAAAEQDRLSRRADRKQQRERLDEIAPRAEPGTKERQMEKKREKAESNRSFREARSPGAEEVGDSTLMGGGDDVGDVKARIKADERRKTEREMRREELLRARAVEREERLTVHRAKEDKTMEMLKAIARERFG